MNFHERVWAEIDLDILGNNMASIRNAIPKEVKIMAVIKADGYGHGALEASKTFLYNGADCLGAAICDEGVSLRQNNISVPILILGHTHPSQTELLVKHNLTQTIFDQKSAEHLSMTAERLGTKADIHIKIDTGMGRLGFLPNHESIAEILNLSKLKGINIKGAYTHFAESGSKEDGFTEFQFASFIKFIKELEKEGVQIPLKHASNSGAILQKPAYNLDMVRPGIIAYGLTPLDAGGVNGIPLLPAMTIKTTVGHVKTTEKNSSIGYGRTYFTKQKTRVATLPVGYADGYLRAMGNKGRVIVNGQFAKIIGNICMDQLMIDVTDIPQTKSGDTVVLMGTQDGLTISAEEIAEMENTINYEVVCGISKRVPRVYVKHNAVIKTVNMLY